MDETPEFSVGELTQSWRRRPVLHIFVFLWGLLPVGALIYAALVPGISSLAWALLPVLFGTFGGLALVLLTDGPWKPAAVQWAEESLSGATLLIPPDHRPVGFGFGQAAATLYLGWIAAEAMSAAWLASEGALTVRALVGFAFFAGPLSLAAMWLGQLIPMMLGLRELPSLPRRAVRVELEGRVLRVDGESFHLGRADQEVERDRNRLLLRNSEDEIVVRGSPAHLTALQTRLREIEEREGTREDVPEELGRIGTAPVCSAR